MSFAVKWSPKSSKSGSVGAFQVPRASMCACLTCSSPIWCLKANHRIGLSISYWNSADDPWRHHVLDTVVSYDITKIETWGISHTVRMFSRASLMPALVSWGIRRAARNWCLWLACGKLSTMARRSSVSRWCSYLITFLSQCRMINSGMLCLISSWMRVSTFNNAASLCL